MNSQFFEQLVTLDGPFFEGFLVLIFSILLARLAPLPRTMQPMVWFHHLALNLATKVNRNERSAQQQKIAGLMAALLLILPFWTIVAFLLELAAFRWFFEFLIIYLCLSDVSFTQTADEVASSLERGDKRNAKQILSEWLSRDTDSLSDIGICKATLEKLATAPVYGTAATIFFFALAGAPLVLAIRMIKQLDLSWPSLDPRFRHFGRYVNLVSHVVLIIPSLLWSLSLAIQGGPRAIKALFSAPKSITFGGIDILSLHIMATVLATELGGPLKFAGIRVDFGKLSYGPMPQVATLRDGIRISNTACIIWFSSIVLIPLLWGLLRYIRLH